MHNFSLINTYAVVLIVQTKGANISVIPFTIQSTCLAELSIA